MGQIQTELQDNYVVHNGVLLLTYSFIILEITRVGSLEY